MPPEPLPAFAAIRITATSTATPRAITSHVFQLQPPRRFIPLELSISNLLHSAGDPYLAIRTDATPGAPFRGDERHRSRIEAGDTPVPASGRRSRRGDGGGRPGRRRRDTRRRARAPRGLNRRTARRSPGAAAPGGERRA